MTQKILTGTTRFFLIVLTVLWVASADAAEDRAQAPPSQQSYSGSVLDPGGVLSGTGSFLSQALGQSADAPESAPPIALKSRPNLNYQPYSSGYRVSPQLIIKPIADYYRVWDNNVFKVENGRKEDTVHRIITGFSSSYGLDKSFQNQLKLSYVATLEYFDRHSSQDHDDHSVGAGGNFKVGEMRLSGDARWSRTSSRGNINLPDPVNTREDATLQGLIQLPMGTFFSEFEVRNYHNDNLSRSNDIYDRNELTLSPRFGINLSAVDQIFFEYSRGELDYMNVDHRDGSFDQEGVGLRHYIDDKTSLTALAAYQTRIYDEDIRPDYHGVVGSLRLQRLFGAQHGITLTLDRKVNESTYLDLSFVEANTFGYDYRRPIFFKNLYLINRGSVSYQEYSQITTVSRDSETRRDYVWGQNIGGEYFLMNNTVSFYVLYGYSSIESNTQTYDIEGQQISYGFKGYF